MLLKQLSFHTSRSTLKTIPTTPPFLSPEKFIFKSLNIRKLPPTSIPPNGDMLENNHINLPFKASVLTITFRLEF